MADLVRNGDTLTLKLTTAEKLEGVHGDIRVPVSSIESIVVIEDVMGAAEVGIKEIGTRIPGYAAMGSFFADGEHTFAIVHHQHTRGIRVRLSGSNFGALIISAADPEAVIQSLGLN